MGYKIEKAAVLGSGTMGSGIAALLAGIGVDVLLLDMPAKDTEPGDPAKKRNATVLSNIKTLKKSRPPQLFSSDDLERIHPGNFEDDLDKLHDRDWVIEVIIENLDIKQNLMAKVAEAIGENTIVSTNTSGLPIHDIAEHLGEDFTRRFMGTHFFNPPRYLKLLEVIPHSNTDPELVEFMENFGSTRLGKGVVLCKDTPNFIGNRFMSMVGMQAMNYALDNDFTVEEVDAITGPLIGRPKTATFNLNDLVGFDVAVHVARNLYEAIPDDPQREVLNHDRATEIADYMLEHDMLGRKTGGGFYKMKRENGNKELWALNLDTMEYEPPQDVSFESVQKHKKVRDTGERIKLMLQEDDRAAEYLWHHHAFYLAYASQRVPEITETIVNIDNAQKWGFNHEMGPFEIWDALGVVDTIDAFEEAGYPVAGWVREMLDSGHDTFYQYDDAEQKIGYYSPQDGTYQPLEKDPRVIRIDDLKASGAELWSNGDGNIYDMGDGVLLWEFTTKANTITGGFIEAGNKAIDMLESHDEFAALVVGNEGSRFSAGANLQQAMSPSGDKSPVEIVGEMIENLHALTLRMKYAEKPVIVAPSGQALGGGAELIMAGNSVVAHMESYIGLVEVGMGLVPAGGGCKELVRRLVNPVVKRGADPREPLQKIFENVAQGKVAESAKQAREMGFIADDDKIIMNGDYLLGEAKQFALAQAKVYEPQEQEHVYAAGRDVYAALLLGIDGFKEAGYATEHDGVVAKELAKILTGGAIAQPQFLPQQVFLNLEKQGFINLAMQEKTMQRIMHFLQTGKPLRN
jgi:3-hydroxyacyl-CoA dehydrogenase